MTQTELKPCPELQALLDELYTPDEQALWLRSPQPLFDNVTSKQMIVDFIAIQELMDEWEDDDPFAACIGAFLAGLFWPVTLSMWVWRWFHRTAPQQGEG